jgi:hypothetical protein
MREQTLMNGKKKNNTRTKRKQCKSYVDKQFIGVLSTYLKSIGSRLKTSIIGDNQYKNEDKGRLAYHLYRYSRIIRLCVGLFKMVKYSVSRCVLIVRLIGRKVFV